MNPFTAKCTSCNSIVSLPSLKARAQSCEACARKRSAALNEARPSGLWGVQPSKNTGALKAPPPITQLPPVDKWEQRARELTEEKRAKGREVWRVVDVDYDPELGERFLMLDRSGARTSIAVSEEQWDDAWNLPQGASSVGCEAVTEYSQLVELRLPRGSIVTPKPAKRPFAVGDRVVVKVVAGYTVGGNQSAEVEHLEDGGDCMVLMHDCHVLNGSNWPGGSRWYVEADEMEHA